MYPPGTNHFNPMSPLFKKEQRLSVLISNVALVIMSYLFYCVGREFLLWHYMVPWIVSILHLMRKLMY